MENKKYIVCRDNIYVGKVVRTDKIHRYEGDSDFLELKQGELDTGAWSEYRSILFVPNQEKLSNDLLYNSPNYPILNITDDDVCLNLDKNSIVIKDSYNLASLLEYFGYNKNLTYKDINKIRRVFFNGKFARENCELFGYRETMAKDLIFKKNGKKITNPVEIAKRRLAFKIEQLGGHRMFSGVSDSPLSHEYWDVLDSMGNNSLTDVLDGWAEKMNVFIPHNEEGPVLKLKRY